MLLDTCGFRTIFILMLAAAAMAGCTRSISNSGYYADSDRGYGQRNSSFYKGELSEYNVLGIDPRVAVAEADIQNAADGKLRISVTKGTSIMVVQSGAMIPDEDMVRGMEKYYGVSVFTGVPPEGGKPGDGYARALRLAAARGGCEKLMVYWGMLETGQENLATQVVSWVPFIGGVIPDQTQKMRIRLKVAIVDVKSGQWEMFLPQPFEDMDISGRYSRVSSDQAQVASLKSKAYDATVEDLVKRFAR